MDTFNRISPLALIIAIALVGLGGMIWHPEGLFNQHSDLISAHLSTQSILHDSWQASNGLPLWRSDILSGQPALTNPQSLFTHPVHFLFALFRSERIVGLVIWLHLVIGALGAYYAGSVLRLSRTARLMLSVSMLFSFKTIMAVYAGWLPVLIAISALPFLFASTLDAFERPSTRSTLALSGASALALHSGSLQLTYYATLLAMIWIVVTIGRLVASGQRSRSYNVSSVIFLGTVIGLGLSAYMLLPLASDVALSTRTDPDYGFFVGRTPSFGLHLLTSVNPELFGSPIDGTFVEAWEYMSFVGWTISFFAFIGAVQFRSHRIGPALLTGLAVTVLLSIPSPWLRVVFDAVPGYSMFRLPSRMLFLSAFFVCCLAGIGLDRALATLSNRVSRTRLAVLAIGLVALEGTFWARRYLRTPTPMPLVTHADYHQVPPTHFPARIAPLSISTPAYGSAAALGWQLVTGYDSFAMRHYQTYIDLLQHDRTLGTRPSVWIDLEHIARLDMLAALNVLFVISPRPLDLPASDYRLAGSFAAQPQFRFYDGVIAGPVYLYQNQRFMPRAFFVSSVVGATDESAAVEAIKPLDLREHAVIIGGDSTERSSPSSADSVEIVEANSGSLEIATRNAQRRFLVVSEVWHPGWSAAIDGQPVRLFQTNVALMGVWVPAGDHRIRVGFWPPGLTTGLAITVLTIGGIIVLFIWSLLHRPSRSAPES